MFFLCKSGILRAQLRRLIPRALWDPNGQQAFPKSPIWFICKHIVEFVIIEVIPPKKNRGNTFNLF